jgi:hypothetical protein
MIVSKSVYLGVVETLDGLLRPDTLLEREAAVLSRRTLKHHGGKHRSAGEPDPSHGPRLFGSSGARGAR